MVYAFNTVYLATVRDGKLVEPYPVVAVFDEKTERWRNKTLGVSIEWLGEVTTLWGDAGDERQFSSHDLREVADWVKKNTL